MKNKLFSLSDMVKLQDNSEVSEPYVRYLCGLEPEHQYRHQEVMDIAALLSCISVSTDKLEGFLYGYVVPQLNKEFDLLKISETDCLNIELKSSTVSPEKLQRQLRQNFHYLKLLNRKLHLYVFISSSKKIYTMTHDFKLVESSLEELVSALNSVYTYEFVDLDAVFLPNNILVSPLNSPDRLFTYRKPRKYKESGYGTY